MPKKGKYNRGKNKKISSKNENKKNMENMKNKQNKKNDVDESIIYTSDDEFDFPIEEKSSISTEDEYEGNLPLDLSELLSIIDDSLKFALLDEENAMKLIESPKKDFLEWHRKDCISIMNYIEKYRNPYIKFEIKKPGEFTIINEPIGEIVTREDLEKRLMTTFLRTIGYYSYIFNGEVNDLHFRTTLLMIGDDIKEDIMDITEELDKKNARLVYRMFSLYQKQHFPEECKNKVKLREYLNFPQDVYIEFGEALYFEEMIYISL